VWPAAGQLAIGEHHFYDFWRGQLVQGVAHRSGSLGTVSGNPLAN
jgi:hypothetical protein